MPKAANFAVPHLKAINSTKKIEKILSIASANAHGCVAIMCECPTINLGGKEGTHIYLPLVTQAVRIQLVQRRVEKMDERSGNNDT